MDNGSDFVAALAVLCIFGLPLAFAIANRYFAHAERMAMIQRGLTPPTDPKWARRASSWGCGPQVGPAPGYDAFGYAEWQANRSLRKGITLAMIGFALLVGLSFIDPGRPGPWLLGGLIPLFVGIAQIIIALLGGARFGPIGIVPPPQDRGTPAGSSAQNAQAGFERPAPQSGPYAWRPGSTVELERPPSPPDQR